MFKYYKRYADNLVEWFEISRDSMYDFLELEYDNPDLVIGEMEKGYTIRAIFAFYKAEKEENCQ